MSGSKAIQQKKVVELNEQAVQEKSKTEEKLALPNEINLELSNLKKNDEQLKSDSKYQNAQLGRLNDKYNALVKQGNVIEEQSTTKIEIITERLQETREELNLGFKGLLRQVVDFDNRINDVTTVVSSNDTKQKKKLSTAIDKINIVISDSAEQLLKKHAALSTQQVTLSEKTSHVITVVSELSDDFDETNAGHISSLRFLEEQLEEQSDLHKKALMLAIESQTNKLDKVATSLTKLIANLDEKQSNEIAELHEKRLQHQMMVAEALDNQEEINDSLKIVDDSLLKRSTKLESLTEKLQQQSTELDLYVTSLFDQTEQLEETTNKLTKGLLAAVNTESKHFKTTVLSLAVIAVLLVASVMYQRDVNNVINSGVAAQTASQQTTNGNVDAKINALTEKLSIENLNLKAELAVLNKQMDKVGVNLKDANDNIEALNGGMSSPFFAKGINGSSTKLYGANWLQNKADDALSIVVYAATNKKALFEYIERWGFYLDADVAYVEKKGAYYLLFGDYATLAEAEAVLQSMPFPMTEKVKGIATFAKIKEGV